MDNKQEKRKLIIDQAKQLFTMYGLRSVTMDDLAEKLGMSKKTLYTYFRDKKDLIENILIDELINMEKIFSKIASKSKNALEVMIKINLEMLKFISRQPANVKYDLRKYYPELWNKIKQIQNVKMFNAVVNNIKRGIKEGYFRKELKPEIIAKLQILRSTALFDGSYADIEDKFSKEQIAKETFKYHIYGICTVKGIKFFKKMNLETEKNKQK